MSKKIQLTLEVDDKGSVTVNKFTKGTADKVRTMTEKSQRHVMGLAGTLKAKLGGAISGVGRALTSLKGIAMTAFAGWGISKVLGEFATFESALADMGKVTGENFESIKKKMMDLPASLGSATELVKGYYQVISAGVKGAKNQIDTLTTSSKLAKTAHADQAQVITGLSSVMDAFKVKSMGAADALQTIEKTGKTTVGGLIPVIGELSSGSAALGISLNEMGAAFAAVTLQSGGTEKAATQYKALLTSLLSPSAQMTELLGKYGGAQAAIKRLGFGGVLNLISHATGGNAEATKKMLGSVEGYMGFLSASANGMATYNANLEEQKNKTGAVDKAWKNYMHTLNAIWDTFKNTIGKQVILIGEKLAPTVKRVTEEVGKWAGENRELITMKVGGWIDSITTAGPKVVGAIKSIIETGKSLHKFLSDNHEMLKNTAVELAKFYVVAKVVGGLTAVITFFKGMTIATGALAAKTLLLSRAMKGNLLVLAGYGAYKAGEFLTNWQMGTDKTKADIEEWTGIKARMEAKLAAAQAAAVAGLGRKVGGDLTTPGAAATGVAEAAQKANEASVKSAQDAATKQIQAMMKVAESDKKLLTDRLSEYTKFYSELQSKITATAELEKRHIQELNSLYKQKADVQKSAEAMIRGLREAAMTPGERYGAGESALNQQYFEAMRMSGQEQVKALEAYKSAVASFAGSFQGGVMETSTRFGVESTRTIVESGKIVEDAVSNIERATAAQQRVLEGLAAEKQRQIAADKTWGDTLQSTARDVAGEIEYLNGVIGGLSAQIEAMQKIIDISAIDNVSPVVDHIQRELDDLHDKTITITTIHRTISAGGGGDSSAPSIPAGPAKQLGSRWIPRSGMYPLHRGEEVTSAKSPKGRQSATFGDIIIQIPESAAPQRPEDWREITRNYIKPELEKMNA